MTKYAYFAGGCFWCITPVFRERLGISQVVSGYSGGREKDPSYADVKAQKTGHRETVRVSYDPEKCDFAQLFDLFVSSVDPFDGEGQFIDRGHSYTLAVYCTSTEEKRIALSKTAALESSSGQKVHIAVEDFTSFYPAEEEHQDYYLKHPEEFRKELVASGRKKEDTP